MSIICNTLNYSKHAFLGDAMLMLSSFDKACAIFSWKKIRIKKMFINLE
jgi:hypothetical protein